MFRKIKLWSRMWNSCVQKSRSRQTCVCSNGDQTNNDCNGFWHCVHTRHYTICVCSKTLARRIPCIRLLCENVRRANVRIAMGGVANDSRVYIYDSIRGGRNIVHHWTTYSLIQKRNAENSRTTDGKIQQSKTTTTSMFVVNIKEYCSKILRVYYMCCL